MRHGIAALLALCTISSCGKGEEPVTPSQEQPVPSVPQNVKLHKATENSLTFQWDAVEGAKSYDWKLTRSGAAVAEGSVSVRNVTVPSLTAGTEYGFSVRAVGTAGASAYSAVLEVKTEGSSTPDPGPSSMVICIDQPLFLTFDKAPVLGTSGIVRPFSNEAFVESVHREVEVAIAVGTPLLVINSGAKSEAFLKARYPDLPAQAFVHYGNFIGETLKIAADLKVRNVAMGIMLGKAVKLAEGHLDTHSKSVVMNKAFLKELAASAGCSAAAAESIDRLTLARELWTALSADDARSFFGAVIARCQAVCETAYPPSAGTLTILLMDEKGNFFGA